MEEGRLKMGVEARLALVDLRVSLLQARRNSPVDRGPGAVLVQSGSMALEGVLRDFIELQGS